MSPKNRKILFHAFTSQVQTFKDVQVNEFAANYPKAAVEIKALEIEDNLRICFPSS